MMTVIKIYLDMGEQSRTIARVRSQGLGTGWYNRQIDLALHYWIIASFLEGGTRRMDERAGRRGSRISLVNHTKNLFFPLEVDFLGDNRQECPWMVLSKLFHAVEVGGTDGASNLIGAFSWQMC